MSKRRLNVQEAAKALGISVDAVRMRARRGSLESEHEDGRLYVWLDTDETEIKPGTEHVTERELVEELRDRVRSLEKQLDQEREANRENRRLLAAALELIPPQLEAPEEPPSEPRESPETATQEPGGRVP